MTQVTEQFPVLYILMRTDLASMNAGKAAAQASHASNAFVHEVNERRDDLRRGAVSENNRLAVRMADEWRKQTSQGFGTVIVLGVNENEMRSAVVTALKLGFIADVIHDPTYPLVDGEIVHQLPLDTCAYVFGDKNDDILKYILQNFDLHP